jgi:hypothetical protein
MPARIDLPAARRVLGSDVLGPDEVRATFGVRLSPPPIPYSESELETAAGVGECLVLRVDHDPHEPLTLLRLIESFPAAFDQRFLRKMGYQLKEEWGIELEPLATSATCPPGWMLVRKHILDDSRNLAYDEHTQLLERYAGKLRLPSGSIRRRCAVEIVYDLLLFWRARDERLLVATWDWSGSRTIDGGYLNVGGFGAGGMQVLSYSPAVRHGALGVCPSRLPKG